MLSEKIMDEHKPLMLLGLQPLTRENVVKGGAAISAALLTTVLRQALAERIE